MRVIPINSVKVNCFLGKTIYDDDGRILLREGVKLTKSILQKIIEHGIQSIYINDEYSSIEIEDVIKPELRQKAIKTVKSTFHSFNKITEELNNTSNLNLKPTSKLFKERDNQLRNMSLVAMELMEELTSQKDLLIDLVDIKSMDNYTYQHCVNVAILSLIMGMQIKLSKEELYDLCMGAILHDIGKVFIPKELLLKNGKLTNEEFDLMKSHTGLGYDYMKNSSEITAPARIIALQHHERIDGKGYPESRDGEKINKYAKLVSVCDVYDALTSDRPYRNAMCPGEALELIMGGGDTQFDYDMVRIFSSIVVPYTVGSLVKLSNGEIAVVEENKIGYPLRPKVKYLTTGEELDLITQLDIVILGIVYNI